MTMFNVANCECLPEAILKVYQDTSGCNPALQQQNSRMPKTGCLNRFSILATERGKRLPESETQRLHRVASCLSHGMRHPQYRHQENMYIYI